ncbi:MAG: ABC transporter permease [Thermoanaerobaculia bacterium]|nr:ABC transporter permease [Thermoanaerobaculia bacterium]
MKPRNLLVVAKREYLTRIRSKGFWIATVALPLLMATLMVVPSLIMTKTRAEERVALVDTTGTLGADLVSALEQTGSLVGEQAVFEVELVELPAGPPAESSDRLEALRAELDRRVLGGEISSWVWVSPESLAENRVEYHAESVSNFLTQQVLAAKISEVVRARRLAEAGFDVETISRLSRRIGLDTVRISEEGSKAEGGGGAFAVAVALFVVLYTTILLYGNQVMLGVLEEKSSRVVEILLAAVAPVELLAGKLLGICCVALTQLAVWLGTAVALTTPGVVTLSLLPAGFQMPTLPLALVLHVFGYFLLGFFLFATFYAMVGAAFNNQQEAQQFSAIGVIFVVAPWMVFMPVLNDPDSTLAVVTSLFPLFTPLLMILRMAVEMPPVWQIALSYALTLAACAGMVVLAARVYRVGILMYGKKPTVGEIWRWMKYRG